MENEALKNQDNIVEVKSSVMDSMKSEVLDKETQDQIVELKSRLDEARKDEYLKERPVELEIEIKDIWREFLQKSNLKNFLSNKADFAVEYLSIFDDFDSFAKSV